MEMSFGLLEMSFGVLEMSFSVFGNEFFEEECFLVLWKLVWVSMEEKVLKTVLLITFGA